ncbi:MAG: hypothetical protein PHX82_17280 [Paracoccaceae bacterium]|nr:hypothetical protein [Paracoccaceae bacterium]
MADLVPDRVENQGFVAKSGRNRATIRRYWKITHQILFITRNKLRAHEIPVFSLQMMKRAPRHRRVRSICTDSG